MKLSEQQHGLLSLIHEATRYEGDDAANPIVRYWIPGATRNYCKGFADPIYVGGAGDANCLKAMERRGWIKHEGTHPYGYSITETGIVVLESHREKTGFYTGGQ